MIQCYRRAYSNYILVKVFCGSKIFTQWSDDYQRFPITNILYRIGLVSIPFCFSKISNLFLYIVLSTGTSFLWKLRICIHFFHRFWFDPELCFIRIHIWRRWGAVIYTNIVFLLQYSVQFFFRFYYFFLTAVASVYSFYFPV